MKKILTIAAAIMAIATLALGLSACVSDADRASTNLSTAAENFEVERRITVINAITNTQIMVVEGRCSVETAQSALAGSLEVTCKIAENEYRKNYVYLADNVTASVEQLDPIDVSVYNYRFIIKPENIIPEIGIETGEQ